MSAGSLELSTTSRLGNFTQTGGILIFDNANIRPDDSLDFDHSFAPGTTSEIGLNVDQAAGGTIRVASGNLELRGADIRLGGKLTGAGELDILGKANLTSTALVDVASLKVVSTAASLSLESNRTYAGAFTLGGVGATLQLNNHILTLTGQAIFDPTDDGAKIAGPGTLAIAGSARGRFNTDGAAVIKDTGIVNQTGNSIIGTANSSGGRLQIDATGAWNLLGDVSTALSSGVILSNAGTFAKTGGSGTSTISGGTLTSTGTIDVQSGILTFVNAVTTLGGHITGTGKLILGAGSHTLLNGLSLDVAALTISSSTQLEGDLAYGGSFVLAGIGTSLQLKGHTFTLGGVSSFDLGGDGASFTGSGTLKITGTASGRFLLSGKATLDVSGSVTQTSSSAIGTGSSPGGRLQISTGGTWTIANDAALDLSPSASFANAGLLQKTSGSGTSIIAGGTITNTGTVKVDSGTLFFANGSGNLGGRLTGLGEIDTAGTYTLADGVRVDVAKVKNGGQLTLGGNLTYDGALRNESTINLAGHALTLSGSGSVLLGTINGTGTILVSGSASLNGANIGGSGAITLQNYGAIEQSNGVGLKGKLLNNAGHTYTLVLGDLSDNGGATVTNNGVFEKSGDAGSSRVTAAFTNNGMVIVEDGSLTFNLLTNIGIIRGVVTQNGSQLTVTADAAGQTHLTGGTGNNRFVIDKAPTLIDGGAGTDTLVITKSMTLAAGSLVGVEKIEVEDGVSANLSALMVGESITAKSAAGGDCTVRGTGGGDAFVSGAGDDAFYGNAGDDTYVFNGAGDRVFEAKGGGVDKVFASTSYTLAAGQEIEGLQLLAATGSAALNLTGNEFAQTITGNNGNNVLDGGGGADTLEGEAGNDTYRVDNARDIVVEAAGQGTDTVITTVSYRLAAGQSIEILQTADAKGTTALVLTGNEITNKLIGNAGANLLDGGAGIDEMRGGAGNDTYRVDNTRDIVVEAAGQGTDTVVTTVNYALKAGQQIEILQTADAKAATALKLTGNEFANTLIGNAGANVLDGGAGIDEMRGGAGNDTYFVDNARDRVIESAKGGTDTVISMVSYALAAGQEIERLQATSGKAKLDLTGNAFGQTLVGNTGANVVDGGLGTDLLTGGAGADTFVFSTALGAGNVDRITDFATEDTIRLSKSVFAALAPGQLGASALKNLDKAKIDADDRVLYKQSTGELFYDADGSGKAAAVKFAVLDNHAALTHLDFLVV
ncbi:hypothetical protein LNAOJCKE_5626 [Methylorubrum aminovorans]|uniref:Calcium-binding protein n=2 Tax=Methylorubrum aminovorans TaxID=269069 RepID=A0ABQ4UN11_9HYPH|nr:hypothetical protein LNAOJCKE_5626 [Methylorubrum aminovorans]